MEQRLCLVGDNESVMNQTAFPHSKLHKRHNALSYHRTREAEAAGITRHYWIDGKTNPADILSKHWSYSSVWGSLRPLLFWEFEAGTSPSGEETDTEDWRHESVLIKGSSKRVISPRFVYGFGTQFRAWDQCEASLLMMSAMDSCGVAGSHVQSLRAWYIWRRSFLSLRSIFVCLFIVRWFSFAQPSSLTIQTFRI